MKQFFLFILMVLCSIFLVGAKLGSLSEVMKPDMMAVSGGELYISEGANFYVYSISQMKLLRKFGKQGEGPGELLVIRNYPNKILVHKNQCYVTGVGKVIIYDKEGKFVKEFKTKQTVIQLLPVGKNYVAKEFINGPVSWLKVALYSPEMKRIKELYKQIWPRQRKGGKLTLDMAMDFPGVVAYKEKIFIEKSPEGFVIDVFDAEGNPIYKINKDYTKKAIDKKEQEKILAIFKEDPVIKDVAKQVGGWAGVKRLFQMDFPKAYPPIKAIEISDGKIYIMTYLEKNNKVQYVVLNLKGKIEKRVYLPKFLDPNLYERVAGTKRYAISNGKLYYLVENSEEEEWELFVEQI